MQLEQNTAGDLERVGRLSPAVPPSATSKMAQKNMALLQSGTEYNTCKNRGGLRIVYTMGVRSSVLGLYNSHIIVAMLLFY